MLKALHRAKWIGAEQLRQVLTSIGVPIGDDGTGIDADAITSGTLSPDRLPAKKQHTPDIHAPLGIFSIDDIASASTLVVQIPLPFEVEGVIAQLENWADVSLGVTAVAVALAEDSLDDGTGLNWVTVYTAGQPSYGISPSGYAEAPCKGHESDLAVLAAEGNYNYLQVRMYFEDGGKVHKFSDGMYADLSNYPGDDGFPVNYACDVLAGDSVTTIGAADLQQTTSLMIPGGIGFSGKIPTVQMVGYGDSLMYGAGASRITGAWIARAARLLSGENVYVALNNNGKVGHGHQDSMVWARCDAANIYPDILVINVNSPNNGDLDGAGFFERFVDAMATVKKYNALGVRCFVTTQPPFTSCTHTEDRLNLNEAVLTLQSTYNYTAIDLATLWQDEVDPSIWKTEYYSDGLHPNEAAHIAAGTLAASIIEPVVLRYQG